MSHKPVSKQQQSADLHSLFRSQIVQNYPPIQPAFNFNNQSNVFIEDQAYQQKNQFNHKQDYQNSRNRHGFKEEDFVDLLMRDAEIVQQYPHSPQPKRRSLLGFDNIMGSESDGREVPSRNSSLSSKDNNMDFQNRSFQKLPTIMKKFSDDFMDIEEPLQNQRPAMNYRIPDTPVRLPVKLDNPSRDRQKSQKINKIQQVGCNCRKSKCLKMYCECFHLQIFCSQNCNCVGCGNIEPNQGHQQAVIDALTRNPKAFEEQKPTTQKGFTLGVELAEVKKGCKCKKTKCLKKYCQCFNSGSKCGIFCKCESCENNN